MSSQDYSSSYTPHRCSLDSLHEQERLPLQTTNQATTNIFGSASISRSDVDVHQSLSYDTSTSQLTIVPHAPSPPPGPTGTISSFSDSSDTSDDLYGPDRYRLFRGLPTPPVGALASASFAPHSDSPSIAPGYGVNFPTLSPPFGLGKIAGGDMGGADGQMFKSDLAREASNITPGVDDTPYLLYALNALTGNVTTSSGDIIDHGSNALSGSKYGSFPYRCIADEGMGYYRPQSLPKCANTNIGTAALRIPTDSLPTHLGADRERRLYARRYSNCIPRVDGSSYPVVDGDVAAPNAQELRKCATSSNSTLVHAGPQPPRVFLPSGHLSASDMKNSWVSLDLEKLPPHTGVAFPPLLFKPAVLRSSSMAFLLLLCLLMAAALAFCAVYSSMHNGLVTYSGSIYSGQFFLFHILPPLASTTLLLYYQTAGVTVLRILPFSRMQGFSPSRPHQRNGAIFDDLYPRSFLWPQISRTMPWRVGGPLFIIWLANITVPLQSTLFSVTFVDGEWRWAIAQGIAWTLVVFYLCLAVSIGCLWTFWYGRVTGLIWDPRSIADFVALASNSNAILGYRGTELMGSRSELRVALRHRSMDKLGYWTWRDGRSADIWHGIGSDMIDDTLFETNTGSRVHQEMHSGMTKPHTAVPPQIEPTDIDLEALALSAYSEGVRYRYLPWCLQSGPLFCFIGTFFLLFLALLIVSFLPSTNIGNGFRPYLQAAPVTGAFSAANFLYRFLPALLGQILFLLFLGFDMELRIVQPWAELSRHAGGAEPEASILADYAACLPLQSTWHAVGNGHWRVAAVSLMAAIFAILPALAGGVFMALTMATGEVRMVPNMAVYTVVIVLLALYLCCLVLLVPDRGDMRLPHAVTCVAEILSFCVNDDLMREPAFKNVRDKKTLLDQLGTNSRPIDRSRWIFANGTSGDDRRLGLRRMRRYTEFTNRPSRRRQRQLRT